MLVAVGACKTTVDAIHDPLYRASTHVSTITATAANSSVGLGQIDIVVTTGEMTDCTELGVPASVIPCRRNATTITHTCSFSGSPSTATCDYTQTLGNEAIVSYVAKAIPTSGGTVSTPEVTYSGGFPPTAGIARPVWWRRDQPMAGQIDIGFFPDADYGGDYLDFTGHLQTIALGAFFNSGQQFASVYSLFHNEVNLWAAPFGADGSFCSFTFNTLASSVAAAMDGQVIIHRDNFRDCAAITLGGNGTTQGNLGDADWVFVHESGHFLHGQGDEYVGGGNSAVASCRNVFSSQANCQAAAPGVSADPANCVQIGTSGVWRIDDGSLETMEDRNDNSDFRDNSASCVINRFQACAGGTCY